MRKVLLLSLILGAGLFADALTKNYAISSVCTKRVKSGECNCRNFKFLKTEPFGDESISADGIIYGDFVNSDEMIVLTSGCEDKFNAFGGYIFFKSRGNRWHFVKYLTPRLGDKCEKVKLSNKRDALICQSSYSSHGYFEDYLFLYTFDKSYKAYSKKLYEGVENMAAVGEDSPDYKDTSIKKWMVWEEDGKTHLIIKANDNNYKRERTKTINLIIE